MDLFFHLSLRGFQQGLDPTDGRISTKYGFASMLLRSALSFVSICVFFQADTRLKALLRAFPDSRKKRTTFSALGPIIGSPGLEIIFRVGKILPMVLHGICEVIMTGSMAGLSWMDYSGSVVKRQKSRFFIMN